MQKRALSWLVAITAMIATAVAVPAATASALPVAPSSHAGHYRLHYNWNHTGFTPEPMTLRRNHTGSAGLRARKVPLTWSVSGEQITIVITADTRVATYQGTTTAAGFGTRTAPGTMSNNIGDSGTWYAVRVEKT